MKIKCIHNNEEVWITSRFIRSGGKHLCLGIKIKLYLFEYSEDLGSYIFKSGIFEYMNDKLIDNYVDCLFFEEVLKFISSVEYEFNFFPIIEKDKIFYRFFFENKTKLANFKIRNVDLWT